MKLSQKIRNLSFVLMFFLFFVCILIVLTYRPVPRKQITLHRMHMFEWAILRYYDVYHKKPHGDSKQIIDELLHYNFLYPVGYVSNFPIKSSPKYFEDAWGKHFVVDKDKDDNMISIHSVGQNGVDEHGNGDDIILYFCTPGT